MNVFSLIQTSPETSSSAPERTSPTDVAQAGVFLQRAEQCIQTGCYEQALEAWKRVISQCPDSAYAYLNLGGILTELHIWPEAIGAFQQAVQLQPELKEAHYGLGMSYGQLGYFSQAIESFQQAMQISADVAATRYHEARHQLYASVSLQEDLSHQATVTSGREHEKSRRSRGRASANDSQNGDRAGRRFWKLWNR